MPLYDYRCSACGVEWEETAKITAPATEFCPECGAKTAQRLISKVGFKLKKGGAGWAKDGYAPPKPKGST